MIAPEHRDSLGYAAIFLCCITIFVGVVIAKLRD